MIVLDTDLLIALLREDKSIPEVWEELSSPDEGFATTVINRNASDSPYPTEAAASEVWIASLTKPTGASSGVQQRPSLCVQEAHSASLFAGESVASRPAFLRLEIGEYMPAATETVVSEVWFASLPNQAAGYGPISNQRARADDRSPIDEQHERIA